MLAPRHIKSTDLSPLPNLQTGKPTFHSLPPVNLQTATKKEIVAYFENAYDINETLFSCIKYEQDFYTNPDELRLILMFYLVHPASLFVNKLIVTGALNERIDIDLETMCETGVDEMSWDDVVTVSRIENRGFQWPTVAKAMEYRAKVRKLIIDLIEKEPLELPITQTSQNGFWWAILLSVEHERIHIETSSCLLRQLPIDRIQFPPLWEYAPVKGENPVLENNFIPLDGKMVRLGKPENFPFFGWCNEYGKTDIQVPDFQAQQFKVTNRQFLQFVNDNGYNKEKYWSKEGWKWRNYINRNYPLWWVKENLVDGDNENVTNVTNINYKYRAMFSIIDLPLDWPVDVNYHEGKAYCNWLGEGYRLPCESEHWVMRGLDYFNSTPKSEDEFTFSGSVDNLQANSYLKYASSTPVNMFPPNSLGFYDLHGNVWEWCEDHFNGFDGFKSHFIYDDYASPCFDGRHNVIVGGSWVSSGDESSIWSRYGFRRHFMQHAGFRVVKSNNSVPVRLISSEVYILGSKDEPVVPPLNNLTPSHFQESANAQIVYDTPERLTKTIKTHWGENAVKLNSDFASKVIEIVTNLNVADGSVLDVGCEIGSSCFYLSKHFQKVKGVDFCGRNIEWAMKILNKKSFKHQNLEISIPTESRVDRIQFYQLTWLPVEVGSHNLVLFNNNYMNRVSTPKSWLLKLREVVLPGGVAILTHSISTSTSAIDIPYFQQLIGGHFDFHESFDLLTPAGNTCVSVWRKK